MTSKKKLFLSLLAFCFCASLHAQVEVAHLFTKGESATGYGAFIHAGFPVGKADEASGEVGLYYFYPSSSHIAFVPLLAGYRYTIDRSGAGWYLEPFAGYSFSSTDIVKVDGAGNPEFNSDGTAKDIDLSGAAAGLGIGYIIPSAKWPLNFGLRYEHMFVSGTPSIDMLSFRVSWSLLTAKRLQK